MRPLDPSTYTLLQYASDQFNINSTVVNIVEGQEGHCYCSVAPNSEHEI